MARRRRYKTPVRKRNVGVFLLVAVLAALLSAVFSGFMLDFLNGKVYDTIAVQFFTTTSTYVTTSVDAAAGTTATLTVTTTMIATEAINIMDKVMSVVKIIFNIITPILTLSAVILVFRGGNISLKKLVSIFAVLPSFYVISLVIAILVAVAVFSSGAGTFTIMIAQIVIAVLGILGSVIQIYIVIDMFEAVGFKIKARF